MNMKGFGLTLLGVLVCGIHAQFASMTINQEVYYSQYTSTTGYRLAATQNAVLGHSVANGMDDVLLVVSDVNVLSVIHTSDLTTVKFNATVTPASQTAYAPVVGEAAITYEHLGGMVVLRPLNGTAQPALVAFASTRKLYVYEITLTGTTYAATLKKVSELPENSKQSTGNYSSAGGAKRLALLSSSEQSGNTYYHLAIGNPTYQAGANAKTGRVDFITVNGTTGSYTQPNSTGITSLVPTNMYALGASAEFGSGLASLGDLDGDGVNDLAVLAKPNSIYVIPMQDASTPKATSIKEHGGDWTADAYKLGSVTSFTPNCAGLSSADLDGDKKLELVMNCATSTKSHGMHLAMDFSSSGDVSNRQILSASISGINETIVSSPLILWNNDNQAPQILNTILYYYYPGSGYSISRHLFSKHTLFPIDLVANYSLEAGAAIRSDLANLDSLFYRHVGITGYTFKNLTGLVNCEMGAGKTLSCKAPAEAAGSWSSIEVSATGACDALRPCKLKDTVHIEARSTQNVNPALALRLPRDLVLPQNFTTQKYGALRSWAYLQNYSTSASSVLWSGFAQSAVEGKAVTATSSLFNEFSLSSKPDASGIDTLRFALTLGALTQEDTMRVHVVAPENLITGCIAADPSAISDKVYSAANGQYVALPLASASGSLYSYDVAQSLGNYAELVGGYLHILMVDEVPLTVNYTVDGQLKTRTVELTLASDPALATHTAFATGSLRVRTVAAGILLDNVQGAYDVRVLGLDGREWQRVQGVAHGSALVQLSMPGIQIVRVQTLLGCQVLKVVR